MRSILVSYQYKIYPTTVPYSYSCGKGESCSSRSLVPANTACYAGYCSVKHDIVFVMPNAQYKDKNTTVLFSVRLNCTYGCQMYLYYINNSILAIYGLRLWKPSEIVLSVDKSLKIIKLIILKNAVRLILDNFGIVGFLFFGRIQVDSSHFNLHFDTILSPKDPKNFISIKI
jgi:hypothetical protein